MHCRWYPACLAAGLRGGWYPSMPCRWYPSMPCSRSPGGGWYSSMPCRWYPSMPCSRSPSPHPVGKLRGLARGVSRPTTGTGSLQAHTWGGGSPGPHLGRGCVSQDALRQNPPPPPWTATAAGGTHPTGMHSC